MIECHPSDSYSAPPIDAKTSKNFVGTQLQGYLRRCRTTTPTAHQRHRRTNRQTDRRTDDLYDALHYVHRAVKAHNFL